MASLTGRVARIAITAAAATPSTDNAADLSTDGVTLPITSTGRRHWVNNTTSLVVAVGGTPTTDAFTADYVQGIVTFSTPHSTSSTYTIDVDYLTSSFVGEGRSWEVHTDTPMQDRTVFSTSTSDVTWRKVLPGITGGTVTIERFAAGSTGPAFFDRLAAGTETIVELWMDHATRNKLEGFAYVSGDGYTLPVAGDPGESVTLTLNGALSLTTV